MGAEGDCCLRGWFAFWCLEEESWAAYNGVGVLFVLVGMVDLREYFVPAFLIWLGLGINLNRSTGCLRFPLLTEKSLEVSGYLG